MDSLASKLSRPASSSAECWRVEYAALYRSSWFVDHRFHPASLRRDASKGKLAGHSWLDATGLQSSWTSRSTLSTTSRHKFFTTGGLQDTCRRRASAVQAGIPARLSLSVFAFPSWPALLTPSQLSCLAVSCRPGEGLSRRILQVSADYLFAFFPFHNILLLASKCEWSRVGRWCRDEAIFLLLKAAKKKELAFVRGSGCAGRIKCSR